MKVQTYWNSSPSICQITNSCLPILASVLLFQVLWGFQTYISKFSFQQPGETGLQNLSLASSQRIWSIRERSNTGSGKNLHTSFSFARAQAANAWPRAKGCTERWGWVRWCGEEQSETQDSSVFSGSIGSFLLPELARLLPLPCSSYLPYLTSCCPLTKISCVFP